MICSCNVSNSINGNSRITAFDSRQEIYAVKSESVSYLWKRLLVTLALQRYALYGDQAEYARKRTVCGLEGMEWMVEKDLPDTRYYDWIFVGKVPDVGKVRFEISLEGPRSMREDWHETIWDFILNSVRLQAGSQNGQGRLRKN